MVEAQHTESTMKIVDNEAEQTLLENLLEGSTPVQPTLERGNGPRVHYLLATPFRYTPARGGHRFRALTDPGVFYGAESVLTAHAAETSSPNAHAKRSSHNSPPHPPSLPDHVPYHIRGIDQCPRGEVRIPHSHLRIVVPEQALHLV